MSLRREKSASRTRSIDAVRYNKEASWLADKETTVIRMGRQLRREHKLDSGVFANAMELFEKRGPWN